MTSRQIPAGVVAAQTRASDPAISTFVAANAGSGKTHVLVSRVIRLMLSGVRPDAILCITFTKAAAANMQSRVFETLGKWVALDDAHLRKALATTGAQNIDAKILARARKLFAEALETPGGLKVLTIHALCTRLLQQFPFEANVPARFTVIEERDRDEILSRATMDVLLQCAERPDSPLGEALAFAMREAADMTLHDMMRQALFARESSAGWTESTGGIEAALAELARGLDVDPHLTLDGVEAELLRETTIEQSEWKAIADAVAAAPGARDTDKEFAARLRDAASMRGNVQADAYLAVFETLGGGLRANLITKKVREELPDLNERLAREKDRIEKWRKRRAAARILQRTSSMLTLAQAARDIYEAEKRARGLLDFDDLIDKTLALLESGFAQWVHYKLDRGIDHVLVDEAQDTSPKQWDIVTKLVAEFTAGKGARETKRTLFAVGDEKQSIFSFQGAAPREFAERRAYFRMLYRQAELAWEDDARLSTSFRSGAAILQAVDAVFAERDIFASIHEFAEGPQHASLPGAAPACVDLWEPEAPGEETEMQGWQAPLDAESEASPRARLARRIAEHAGDLIAAGTTTGVGADRRAIGPGDIIVLVRNRGPLFDAVIQALKRRRIPVAGADRLKLTEHIAVADLMALGDAVLLPQDDLALASALKSPLFGLSEDALMQLAVARTGTLRDAILGDGGAAPGLQEAAARLHACLAQASASSPFAFYSWVLNADGGRARMLRRLDLEAADALDEFLELAARYEQRTGASLQGFLAFLRAAETEVKRDMEGARDEVRVMTVHGAKGLEASIVFLADTVSSAHGGRGVKLLKIPRGNASQSGQTGLVWAGRKEDDPEFIASARASAQASEEDEHRRLLYVAMTRAADRLIVGCALNKNQKNGPPDKSWYALIRNGLEKSGLARREIDTPLGRVLRFEKDGEDAAAASLPAPRAEEPAAEPDWLRRPVAPPPATARALRPSHAEAPTPQSAHADFETDKRQHAIRRGNLVHRLLQSLPDVRQAERAAAGGRFLLRHAPDFTDSARETLLGSVLSLLDAPGLAALFAPGSRAEVAIAGTLAHPGRGDLRVTGQIDRLFVSDTEVLIADYKTGRPPPDGTVPEAYLRQLALYRAVLASALPGRTVRAALVWTEAAEMVELSTSDLDVALTSIMTA